MHVHQYPDSRPIVDLSRSDELPIVNEKAVTSRVVLCTGVITVGGGCAE